jgi:hypothetical protein
MIILSYCKSAEVLNMTGVSKFCGVIAWCRLAMVHQGVPCADNSIRRSAAQDWFRISSGTGGAIALHAPGEWGCAISVVDWGTVRWPACYGTVFTGTRSEHRAMPSAPLVAICLLDDYILACCTDGALVTWPRKTAMCALSHVPMPPSTRVVAICADDCIMNNAVAVTDTGKVWHICADPTSVRFGSTAITGVNGVCVATVECYHGRLLLHDMHGCMWLYHRFASVPPQGQYLVKLAPYGVAETVGCLGPNGHVVVGLQAGDGSCTSLSVVGFTTMSPLQLCPSMPTPHVMHMCTCQRTSCLLAILCDRTILVVQLQRQAGVSIAAAAVFRMPGLAYPLCILSGVVVDTNGDVWCVDLVESCIDSIMMRHLGRMHRGALCAPKNHVIQPERIYV